MKKLCSQIKTLAACAAILLILTSNINRFIVLSTSINDNSIQIIKPLCDEPAKYLNN